MNRLTALLATVVLVIVVLAGGVAAAPAAVAAVPGAWSGVPLPRHATLSGVFCLEAGWCEAVGGTESGHWNGRRWSVRHDLPRVPGGSLAAITCRSRRSCVAVGQAFPRETRPIDPLIERWNGRRWEAEYAPKPRPARGDRGVNATLTAVACPGRRLCFAVGRAVAFGTGNAPGQPLVLRWDGSFWNVVLVPYAPAGLTSISCTSTRACTAVGGFEYTTGRPEANELQAQFAAAVEHWDGRSWSLGSQAGTAGNEVGGLLGVACTSATTCLSVGDQEDTTTYADQAIDGATRDGRSFSATQLAFPAGVFRGGNGLPGTRLSSVACAPADPGFCGAVGTYIATSGAIGPLAAVRTGATWTQTPLRRGPVALTSVTCPAPGWCMALGGGIAERFR